MSELLEVEYIRRRERLLRARAALQRRLPARKDSSTQKRELRDKNRKGESRKS